MPTVTRQVLRCDIKDDTSLIFITEGQSLKYHTLSRPFRIPAISARFKGYDDVTLNRINSYITGPEKFPKGIVESFFEEHIVEALRQRRSKGWEGDTDGDRMCIQTIDTVVSIREIADKESESSAGSFRNFWKKTKADVTTMFYRIYSFWKPFSELNDEFIADLYFYSQTISSVFRSLHLMAGQDVNAASIEYVCEKAKHELAYIADMFHVKYRILTTVADLSNVGYVPPPQSEPIPLYLQERLVYQSSPVGYGGFARVYKGTYYPHDNPSRKSVNVAMKVIVPHINYGQNEEERSRKLERRLKRELRVWSSLKHTNLLPFYGIFKDHDIALFDIMISRWCDQGCISSYINVKRPPTHIRIGLLYEISDALYYLHSRGVVHGDLSDRNVLITKDIHAQLCDFGLSSIVEEIDGVPITMTSTTGQGTQRYMAPELLLFQGVHTSKETDVYSMGVLSFMVLTGLTPYHNIKNNFPSIFIQNSGVRIGSYDVEGRGLGEERWGSIKACCAENPKDRPPAEAVKEWYQSQHKLELELS